MILLIGTTTCMLHMMILLIMFFYSNYSWISNILLDHIWFAGTTTMLLLIEHTAWLYMLWTHAVHSTYYCGLGVAYIGILLTVTSWVMELIIPVGHITGLHSNFVFWFVVGCFVNIIGSIILLPGKKQGEDIAYKYIMGFLCVIGIICSLLFWLWYALKNYFDIHDYDNLPLQQVFQNSAYVAYLSALIVGFEWARQRNNLY
jgi:hypothetical protein